MFVVQPISIVSSPFDWTCFHDHHVHDSYTHTQLDNNEPTELEPTEKSPLNGADPESGLAVTDKELEANGANGKEKDVDDDGKPSGVAGLLSQPRKRILGVVILVSVFAFLALVIAVVVATAGGNQEVKKYYESNP